MNWEINSIRHDEEDFKATFTHKVHGRTLVISLDKEILNWQMWSKTDCIADVSANLADAVIGNLLASAPTNDKSLN